MTARIKHAGVPSFSGDDANAHDDVGAAAQSANWSPSETGGCRPWSVVPGGIATPPRPHTFYLPAQQEEASVDVTVNDAISGPRADGPLLPVYQTAAVKSLGAGTAASADKRYCHGTGGKECSPG